METKNIGILSAMSPTASAQKLSNDYSKKKNIDGNKSFKDTLEQKKMDKPKDITEDMTKDKIYKKDKSVDSSTKKESLDSEDDLKLLKEAAEEIKALLADATALLDIDENPELLELSNLLDKLNSMLEDIKLGDEVKLQEGIQLLNNLIGDLTSDDISSNADVAGISTELLELSKIAKQAEELIKDFDTRANFSETLESKSIVNEVAGIDVSKNVTDATKVDDDVNDEVEARDEQESAYKGYESKSVQTKTSNFKNIIRVVNKAGFMDAYGSNDMQDIENFENMNNANVKVDANSSLFKVNQTSTIGGKDLLQVVDQITQEISVNVNEDVSEMMLKLRPDHLGKLAMRIVIDRGIMVANFEVESQIVKEAIEANLDDLKSSLEDKGLEVQEFNVSVNKDDTGQEQMSRFFSNSKKQNLNKILNEDLKDLKDMEEKTTNYEMSAMSRSIYSTVDYLA